MKVEWDGLEFYHFRIRAKPWWIVKQAGWRRWYHWWPYLPARRSWQLSLSRTHWHRHSRVILLAKPMNEIQSHHVPNQSRDYYGPVPIKNTKGYANHSGEYNAWMQHGSFLPMKFWMLRMTNVILYILSVPTKQTQIINQKYWQFKICNFYDGILHNNGTWRTKWTRDLKW